MFGIKHVGIGSMLLLAFFFAGCSNGSTPTPPGTPFTFQYEVPDYIENAWLVTHDADGNLIASKALSGDGTVTLHAIENGFVTLAVEDAWTENGTQKHAFHLRSYPTSAALDKVLTFSHWPWLKPRNLRLITIRATCPSGATRIAVRGRLSVWYRTCETGTSEYEFRVRADALAQRSDGKLGAVLWAFDANGPTHVAVLEAFGPEEAPTVRPEDWQTHFNYSEVRVSYSSEEEAQQHRLGTAILAKENGDWYGIDTPGSHTRGTDGLEAYNREAYAPLASVEQAMMWYWSMKTTQPNVEGATSILARKEIGIPERVNLSFDTDFAPYPEYVEWANKDGRIWVKTRVEAPSTPTYYYAVVKSNTGNTEKTWSIVLFGDHRNGAVFPELPSNLAGWKPTKTGVDRALVGNDVGTIRWLTVQKDPEGSLESDFSWYVWRWKYVVGSSQTQTLSIFPASPFRWFEAHP